jgi:hypothetical protein
MPPQFKEWFTAARAKALAYVLLTRRDDLEVRETKAENGLDYTVRIKSELDRGPQVFGVLLRATMSPVTIDEANAQLEPTLTDQAAADPFLPVCVFFFTVKDECGYYTWAHEPAVEEGRARLIPRAEADCHPLDDGSLERIVAQVAAWYNALSISLKG